MPSRKRKMRTRFSRSRTGPARLVCIDAAVKTNAARTEQAWFRLGACLHRLNRNQESRQAFHKALDLNFQPVQAKVVIARSYFKDGDQAEGLKWLKQAVDAGFANARADGQRSGPPASQGAAGGSETARADRWQREPLPEPSPNITSSISWLGEWDVMSPGRARTGT